jgi:hypothetical protein
MIFGEDTYTRIRYPDSAENLEHFQNYRVFLRHWDDLGLELKNLFEGVRVRRETRLLGIYGEQGVGKTMFASKLEGDFDKTIKKAQSGSVIPDKNNLWHRITGGHGLKQGLISASTEGCVIKKIEDNDSWVEDLETFVSAQLNRTAIILADNAERSYFRKGLSGLSAREYIELQDDPRFLTMVAQKLVDLSRTKLQRCLFVILSNDQSFMEALQSAINKQHRGLMNLLPLPAPLGSDKETIVRVNTNRLNSVSYWFCLDKAGPNEKIAVYNALNGASTFREAFRALDNAIGSATRIGRPARRNVITLILLTSTMSPPSWLDEYGELERVEFSESWAKSVLYKSSWAARSLKDDRESSLLESEWQLRIVFLGEPFAKLLIGDLSESNLLCLQFLTLLKDVYGPGTLAQTRAAFSTNVSQMVKNWPDVSAVDIDLFWQAGQARANQYEQALKKLFPGYDKRTSSSLSYRPDYTVTPFSPCSILKASQADSASINEVIRRDAHVFEFTAFQNATIDQVSGYLGRKLPNYVEITQEQ